MHDWVHHLHDVGGGPTVTEHHDHGARTTTRTTTTTTTTHDDHGHEHAAPSGLLDRLRHLVAPHSHDAAVAMDSELEASQRGMRALLLSFLALVGHRGRCRPSIVVVSGSVALLVDTIHNFADALTAVPIAVAFTLGRRAANRRYTYGYGRAEDLAGIVVVLVIAGSAVFAAYEAVRRLADPRELDHLGPARRRRA